LDSKDAPPEAGERTVLQATVAVSQRNHELSLFSKKLLRTVFF
jgi:hypothetical protein